MLTNLSYIRQRGFEVLRKELGSAGVVQFMRQFENGSGDYTKERHETLKNVSLDDIVFSINERKKNRIVGK
jgi:hypothetical protein